MRTIKAFNLSPLHVEEDFGFLKQFHDEAVTLRGGSGGDSESPDEIADEVNPVLEPDQRVRDQVRRIRRGAEIIQQPAFHSLGDRR